MKYMILLMGNTVEMAGGWHSYPPVYVDDDGIAKYGVGLDPAFCDFGSALCIRQTLIILIPADEYQVKGYDGRVYNLDPNSRP